MLTGSPTPPTPSGSLASAYGRVLEAPTSAPVQGVAVRLAEVYRSGDEGAFVLDDSSSPATLTDAQGYFLVENIEPNEYVVVIGDVRVAYTIVAEPSGSAKVWELPPGTATDLGVLEVVLD